MKEQAEKLKRLIKELGGVSAVAEQMDISPSAISQWCNGIERIPAERAIQFSQMSAGRVSVYDLRPDLIF